MTLKVAVVGSGPAGFYTADALLKSEDPQVARRYLRRLIASEDRATDLHGRLMAALVRHGDKIEARELFEEYSEALCQGPTPQWFQRYQQYYAIGPASPPAGKPPDTLWFAGMTVRARAWRDLRRGGFRFPLPT